jgi:hypothetical protein
VIDKSGAVRGRAKFVLGVDLVHRALGLGPEMRVVMLHVTRDPDAVHVTVEGDGIVGGSRGVDEDDAVLAWAGLVEAPALPWPLPAGPRPTADRGVTVNMCRVDESVGEATEAVTTPAAVGDAGAHAVGRAWEAAAEAVQLGVPAGTVLHAVEDAVAEGLRAGQRGLRREVLEVVERLRTLLVEQDTADKDQRR